MFTEAEIKAGLAEAELTEAEIAEMARDFIEECKAALETADLVRYSEVSFDAYDDGYVLWDYIGSVLRINPSGKYSHILSGVYIEDYLFWEAVEELLQGEEFQIVSGEGDPLDTYVVQWVASDWSEVPDNLRDRLTSYV